VFIFLKHLVASCFPDLNIARLFQNTTTIWLVFVLFLSFICLLFVLLLADTNGGHMTRLEFIDLIKNMGGDAIVADAIGCSVRTLGRMKASGLIASQYRGAFMLYANKCGYTVRIKQINKVML
jgi:hypothetical protein